MEKEVDNVEKKYIDKFRFWLKDPYNLALFLLLSALIIFRLYWFFHTTSQPLWWDEADYLNMARRVAGSPYWYFHIVRPVLFPFILAGFMLIGLGEITARLFVLFCSVFSVYLLFLIGKKLFDKKTALFSAFMLAVFWSFAFYSHRILADVPVAMLWLATIYLFFNAYFNNKNWKYFALAGLFLGLSFLMKFPSIALVIVLFIYLLTTEKLALFKNKNIIIFYLTSLITVIPFFIWEYITFKNPLAFIAYATESRGRQHTVLLSSLQQIWHSINLTHLVFAILFFVGLLVFLFYIYSLYKKIHVKQSASNGVYFVFLWIFLSVLFFGKVDWIDYIEERYFFIFYPALFLIAGKGLSFIYDLVKEYNKKIAILLILLVLGFGAYQNIVHTNQIMEIKKDSYLQLKEASLFIKAHTNPDENILVLEEPAEILYYSNRNWTSLALPNETTHTPITLLQLIKEKNMRYVLLSFYFSATRQYVFNIVNFILSNQQVFKPVQIYPPYINQEQTIPLALVLEIDKNKADALLNQLTSGQSIS